MPFALPAEPSWPLLTVIAFAVTLAYLMFGATGFGASIVSVPIIAHILPLTFVVPMITAVDCGAVTTATLRQWQHVDWREFRRLLVPLLVGIATGLTLLIRLPRGEAGLDRKPEVYQANSRTARASVRGSRTVWPINKVYMAQGNRSVQRFRVLQVIVKRQYLAAFLVDRDRSTKPTCFWRR
jgi:hypothetical protein